MSSSLNYLSLFFLVFFMEFCELSDGEGDIIRLLLPPKAKVGRPRSDDRMVLNGILYVLVTGCMWMDMPTRYGSCKTAFYASKHSYRAWERA